MTDEAARSLVAVDDALLREVKELLALSVSEQLDSMRLAQGDTVEVFAAKARLSKQTMIDLLKVNTDWRLSTLVKCALASGHAIQISFVPMPPVSSQLDQR